jgi:hypothetical protein
MIGLWESHLVVGESELTEGKYRPDRSGQLLKTNKWGDREYYPDMKNMN